MIAGTVGVIAFLAFFAGTEVGIQGYASLSQIGVAKFSVHLRLLQHPRGGPLVSSIALAATVGAATPPAWGDADLGGDRRPLEVMGIPSLPFLVTTRMVAAFIAVIPLTSWRCASYLSPRLITTMIYGQSPGTHDHYFLQFLPPIDMLWSFFSCCSRDGRDPHPLLLRLHRLRWAGRCRHGGRAGDPHQHRDDRRRRLLPQLRDLGLHDHRPDHGEAPRCWSTSPRQPRAPAAAGRGRRLPDR